MFWQKQKQVASVTFKNENTGMLLTFSSMVVGTDFVVFKKGTVRKAVDSSVPITFQQLYFPISTIFSITIV